MNCVPEKLQNINATTKSFQNRRLEMMYLVMNKGRGSKS